MKTWERYSGHLTNSEWHIHTKYTDGDGGIRDYCQRAMEMGIPLLAFTEHVRRTLTYDFNAFLSDIDDAQDEFDLIILSGCEAKVLPDGGLDVDEEILKEVDYPIFAFHSFPEDVGLYVKCLKSAIRNEYVNAWAHPGTFPPKNNPDLSDDNLIEIFKLMKEKDVLLEINRKHNLPKICWVNLAESFEVKIVKGSDVHQVEDLR